MAEEEVLEGAVGAGNAPTQQQIDDWKKRYGEVTALEAENFSVYVRKPGREEISRFTKELARDMYRASHNLVMACRLYPDAEVIKQVSNDKPGIIVSLAGELNDMVNLNFLPRKL